MERRSSRHLTLIPLCRGRSPETPRTYRGRRSQELSSHTGSHLSTGYNCYRPLLPLLPLVRTKGRPFDSTLCNVSSGSFVPFTVPLGPDVQKSVGSHGDLEVR